MQILGPTASASNVFVIQPGKQITLNSRGLREDETIIVELVELSDAPDFTGNPCCDLKVTSIVVLHATPLTCPGGGPVQMTALRPYVVIGGPQEVAMRVRLAEPPLGDVTVDLFQTDSSGETTLTCECFDSEWVATGVTRCLGGNVDVQEESECGTVRWRTEGPQTWTDSGDRRCTSTNHEKREVNNCGETRWTVIAPLTWTPTGTERCAGTKVQREELNNCGTNRWVDARDITWTPTGETRCINDLFEQQEINDCGVTRWSTDGPITWEATGGTRCVEGKVEVEQVNQCGRVRWFITEDICGYCPSMRLSCDGSVPGFAYHDADIKDPAATVLMEPCAGDTSTDRMWIYPSAGPGHTIKVTDCDGVLIGYAVNRSDCAPECPCASC